MPLPILPLFVLHSLQIANKHEIFKVRHMLQTDTTVLVADSYFLSHLFSGFFAAFRLKLLATPTWE